MKAPRQPKNTPMLPPSHRLIAELKKGYNKLNDWLGGTVDPWTGKPRHDGFIETFPQYQR